MASNALGKLIQIIAPKKPKAGGTGFTGTFNPATADRILTVPVYQEHLDDIFTTRQSNDSRVLLKTLFRQDPDVSAAVFSYLTMANTAPIILARDVNGQIDLNATKTVMQQIKMLTSPTDYTLGFQLKKSLSTICEEMRYLALLRGGISAELVLDKQLAPSEIRIIDLSTIEWYEKAPGQYKPQQHSGSNIISLDIPTFFVSFFKRDPTDIYAYSPFVAAINTIAARQQVINDLYRIMQKTGYPRFDIKIVEEVLVKNAPANIKADQAKLREWMNSRLGEVRTAFEGIRADQAFVHWDSIEPGIVNDKNPGVAVDISSVIDTLNAQNQAGLKTMATVIGRGSAGVNTSSVEARIAAMNADELNEPIAEVLSNMFSLMLQQTGYQGFVEVSFQKAELRPDMELEPQKMLRSQRLRQDLSDGLITDIEYHLMMYNRLPPDGSPQLSGTGFMAAGSGMSVDAGGVTPNSDPLGRSVSSQGAKAARSKAVKAQLSFSLSE